MDIEKILEQEEERRKHLIPDDPDVVETHVDTHTFTEIEIYPEHEQRKTSSLFRRNKKMLQKDMNQGCWICGAKEHLEVHHWIEWSFFEAIDQNKALEVLSLLDAYGFSKRMGNIPFTTPDDIRNLVVLCKDHHRTPGLGIHTITFPVWIAQKADKKGMEVTIPVKTYKKAKSKVKTFFSKIKKTLIRK